MSDRAASGNNSDELHEEEIRNIFIQDEISVVALLQGTGNTSTNTLAYSQRSNLPNQRSTSLAQPIKAGFISSSLPVPQHPPPFLLVGPPQVKSHRILI